MQFASRIIALVVAGISGVVYGIVGTVAQGSTLWGVPVGLVCALVGTGALLLGVRLLTDRGAALAAGIGITVAVLVFSGRGPGGSIIAPSDSPWAMVWTFGAPLLAGLIVAWPQLEALFDRPVRTEA